jgi:flagellar biosynthetic protein FlhB
VAEDPNGGEKTEMPTPKRLQDARNDGQVAFSSEANIAGLLIIGFATLAVMGPSFCQAMGNIITRCLGDALTWDLEGGGLRRLIVTMCAPAFAWLLPFMGVLFAAGLGLCIAQVGFHVSGKALIPKLNRVSPFTGFQRLFGYRGLMRVLLSLLKLTAVILVAWHVLQVDIPGMVPISLDLAARMGHESHTLFTFGMKVACVLAIIAAGDFIFQRWQHTRDMMMTKQEVKEEYKQSEGDPLVKSKIRQIQRQMAQRRMMQEVPKADVVITNPTHVAVALKYDKANMAAPVVLAKGYDEVARRIKELAAKHNIVMVENVPLARALAKEVAIGKAIPTKWYQSVAEVLSMVYKLKKGKK